MVDKTDLIEHLRTRLSASHPLVQVLLGPRQVGKTTAAKEVHEQFTGSKLFVSADGPIPPNFEWLRTHWLRARELPTPTLLVVDEVQKIEGWSEVVKSEFDQDRGVRDLRVLLLGSSSMALQRGLSESLAGRFELLRAYHWTFGQMQRQFGWDASKYLAYGGYPGAAKFADDLERWQTYLRESIIEPVLGRDIYSARSVTKPALFRQTFELALSYPAQQVSYQKIVGQLQERGSVETVKNYLGMFEGAFLMKLVMQYSTRPLSTRTSSPKIIPLAPALIHAFTSPRRLEVDPDWRGHVVESIIGAELARRESAVFYWRDGEHEVDFVIPRLKGPIAIEVKSGRKRSALGLARFQAAFPNARCITVTPESSLPFLRGERVEWLDEEGL